MTGFQVSTFLALLSLLPGLLAGLKSREHGDAIFLSAVAIGVVGPCYWLWSAGGTWSDGLGGALWATIAGTMTVFLAVSLITRAGWRLAPVLLPYIAVMAAIAAAISFAAEPQVIEPGPTGWLILHAVASVMTYAVATVGAVAATAGFIQQRALKHKAPTTLSRKLPSLADCDSLQARLLAISAVVLGLGLMSGTATSLAREGVWISLDHKTILGGLAFVMIATLLVANRRGGVRARQVGRGALAIYLLLTLAYLGVKFVTDFLI